MEYYIRNEGYVGNALVWWGVAGKGYTTDIRQAGKFTLEQAIGICTRPQDTAYKVEYIDGLLEAQKLIIDCQYVASEQRYSYDRLKLESIEVTDPKHCCGNCEVCEKPD